MSTRFANAVTEGIEIMRSNGIMNLRILSDLEGKERKP